MPQTQEQRRAAFALEKISGHVPPNERDKYKTQLVKLPARLHTNGLGQTVAFYLSAGEPPPGRLGKPEWEIMLWLEGWLVGPDTIYGEIHGENGRKLIAAITSGTDSKYRLASAEARGLANWLKRFAEAFLEG